MRFRRPYHEEPEVNLIPLIDVLLIVLIFLAVSTTYSRFAELQIELPQAEANRAQTRPLEIHVGVTADGRIAIERTLLPVVEPSAVAEYLARAASGRDQPLLVIHADAQAPHQAVINVLEAARLANLPRLSFTTQRHAAAR
ncbi:MAG: biopolymer transporter ExbD [Sutterellaceae bacterium]|nr:biopolymer transporter ExbD [Burkholderiaceae bacterium]MCX7901092.1 biopolymer transporter ExbD [Burkholderiaceae bacterium]MDW8430509.1 biopolymer transporter ExbD [Sutterellaceae bacterium]